MIPLFRPSLGEEELDSLREVFKSGWLGSGPKTIEFEKKFAEYVGSKNAVGVNSCTAALHLSLNALNVTSGEVLVPAITFVSTAHAALYNGAKPVFVDVDEKTLCMDIEDMKEKITDKTKAIVPVHLGGHTCDMDAIMEISNEKGLHVIEDVANATGAKYKGKFAGTFGNTGCFSFEAKKNMTTGDGGMIVTDDDNLAKRASILSRCGVNKFTWERIEQAKYSWYYEVTDAGYKYNMNDVMAAIGLVQLKKLDEMNKKREEIVEKYKNAFKDLDWLVLPEESPVSESAWWLFIVKVPERDKFISYMELNGITTGVHFMPIYLHPFYQGLISKGEIKQPNTPVSDEVWKHIVTLPLFPDMSNDDLEKIINTVKSFNPNS